MPASEPFATFFSPLTQAAEAPPLPPVAPLPPVPPRDLLRKAELELAMLAAPDDHALRTTYFEHLIRLAVSNTGLLWASLPDLPAPLYFRAGTPDIAVMAHSFRDDSYAFEVAATPQRILMIGAYAGYLAVDFARRFPRAVLLCAEPLAENFRLLSLNTTPWRRIRVAQAAVWHHNARLAPLGRVQADWSVRLGDGAVETDRMIGAISVAELLGRAGWRYAEMVVCDACGSEREIFADPFAPWLRYVDVALVRLHEASSPGATKMVEACFDSTVFDRRKVSDMEMFVRRTPLMALPPGPPEMHVVRAEPGPTPFQLRDVISTGWAFFVFDGMSCQLHPNPPGQAPASVVFPITLAGHTKFASGLQHAGNPGATPVQFTAIVQREDGSVLGRGEAKVVAHESGRLSLSLPGGSGPARVVLQTAVAADAPNNHMCWARWINPTLS